MTAPHDPDLEYYTRQGPMSDPGSKAALLDELPTDAAGCVRVVQGLLLHVFWAERYGFKASPARQAEVQIRRVADKLDRILALDPTPLADARPLERRLIGNCRDFSLLMTSILRHHGIPARARCGFGTYFRPNHYEDHWVCEYWEAGRWVMVDPQLDAFQCRALRVDFDPLDMPAGRFVPGGTAWRMCRAGGADPDSFGIFELRGLGFVRGNVVRDLLALGRLEVLPWDRWGIMGRAESDLTPEDYALVDRLADLADAAPAEIAAECEQNALVGPPAGWADA